MKTDTNRKTGKWGPPMARQRRDRLEQVFLEIDRDTREPRKRQLGPKRIAIEIYKKYVILSAEKTVVGDKYRVVGRNAAYSFLKSKFKTIDGKEIYTKEMVNGWIDEYERDCYASNEKGRNVNDDDDAR